MRRISRFFWRCSSWLAVSLTLPGCSGQHAPPANEPPAVQVSYPIEQVVTDILEFQGRTVALYSVDVRAQVTGYLENIYFKEGTEVVGADYRPQIVAGTVGLLAPAGGAGPVGLAFSMNPTRAAFGDPLYLIDPDVYEANVAKAEADLKTATAAEVLYRATYEITVNAKQGSSALDRTQALGQLQQAQGQVLAGKASLDWARKDLAFCRIDPPLTGKLDLAAPGRRMCRQPPISGWSRRTSRTSASAMPMATWCPWEAWNASITSRGRL
jgi:multidrug efflux pump subunit AcrA (membrane-fusion protein)